MGEQNGIETAAALRKNGNSCIVVFITTSTEHMPNAFSVHAFDYIVKPIEKEKIFRVLDEVVSLVPEVQPYINITYEKTKHINFIFRYMFYNFRFAILYHKRK